MSGLSSKSFISAFVLNPKSNNGDTLSSTSLNDTPALKYPIVAPILPVT